MKVYIIPTKNIMTTAYYYTLLEKIFKAAGFDVLLCDDLKKYHPSKKNDIIITGNAYPTVKLWIKGYKNICTWYQGVAPEERKMQGSFFLKVWLHSIMEQLSLKKSIFSFFVSNALVKHYAHKYKINIEESHYAVIPCFNDNKPNLDCFQPGVKKAFSFVYSGGMGVWQCFDKTLEVFKLLKKNIPESTLTIYTYQVDDAQEIVKKNGIKDVTVSYVPKEEMNKALSSMMFGFVLREDNPVNRVATPTKLSNYIANGVIPICSTVVEDFTSVTSDNKYVIHVNNLTPNLIAEEIYDKVKTVDSNYSAELHLKECMNLFELYYSEEYYVRTVSKKIRDISKTL